MSLGQKIKVPKRSSLKIKKKAKEEKSRKTLREMLEKVLFKGEPLFTESQIGNMVGLRDSEDDYYFALSDGSVIFEFVGNCYKMKSEGNDRIDEEIELIREKILSAPPSDELNLEILFESLAFEDEKKTKKQEIDSLTVKTVYTKGIAKCPRCIAAGRENVTNTSTRSFQTRSADEPQTNFNECNSCGHKWKN